MIEAEIRAGEKAETRMKNADAREDRTTAKQQADHSRKKIESFQTLPKSPGDYCTLIRTPLAVFDVNDVLDATSKVTTRGARGQNTNRMNLARGFTHQSGITTVCKRVDSIDPVL